MPTVSHRILPYITALGLLTFASCKVEISHNSKVSVTTSETSSTLDSAVTSHTATARVLSYNIQYFSTEAIKHGDRIEKLSTILNEIKPTIVGVEEVQDRTALELIFPPDEWTIIIDDDSPDKQDVALVVRKPWKVLGVADDLDADDENFLAPESEHESFFPIRRDGLFVTVATPDGKKELTAIVIHAKARVGGRSNTDARREGASRILLEKLKGPLKDKNVVIMGDFNDTPDDASMNILETGNPNAPGRMETEPDTFMINLAEPLWAKNMVSHGASARRLDKKTGLINNVYPDARSRNDRLRGREAGTGPVLLDQILISQSLKNAVTSDTMTIYLNPLALEGPGFSRPSDHLPVYTDINLDNATK